MKKIDSLILKTFIRPFFSTFSIVMFLLLMLFLFKYIDDLVGKGFEWYVVLELMFYASASQVSVALPLAVLLSAIMTFGSLGEQYELVALKSGGISLKRALAPLFILVAFISAGAFLFSNYILPVANLKMFSLLYDVRQQKPSFLIKEGIFYDGIEGYTIRVDKNKEGKLNGVMIYNHSGAIGNSNVLLADSGEMIKSEDGRFLTFKLRNGVRYEEKSGDAQSVYNPRRQFTRVKFEENETKFDLSGFKLNRTDESLFKSNFLMLNIKQLSTASDSLGNELKKRDSSYATYVKPYFRIFKPAFNINAHDTSKNALLATDKVIVNAAMNEMRNIKSYYESEKESRESFYHNLLRFMIEYHRRFTISVACLVFFIIGAPLGAIVRKGGLGMPVVISVSLFILNYIVSMTTEKYCRDATLPVQGMWIATIIFVPAGLYLLHKAGNDSAIFSIDTYSQLWNKMIPKKLKSIEK